MVGADALPSSLHNSFAAFVCPYPAVPDRARAWRATLEGNDVLITAPVSDCIEEEILPPLLARLAGMRASRLFVFAPAAQVAEMIPQIVQMTARIAIETISADSGGIETQRLSRARCVVASPETWVSSSLQVPELHSQPLLLAILGADVLAETHPCSLRAVLASLPQPQQVLMLVRTMSEAAGELVAECLCDPVFATFEPVVAPRLILPSSESTSALAMAPLRLPDNLQAINDKDIAVDGLSVSEEQHIRLMAKFIGNIVCRSSNEIFKDSVRNLLSRPRKPGVQDVGPEGDEEGEACPQACRQGGAAPEAGLLSADDREQELRDGIASLLISYRVAVGSTSRAKGAVTMQHREVGQKRALGEDAVPFQAFLAADVHGDAR